MAAGKYLVEECYRRAAEAHRIADAYGTPAEKKDLLDVERRWLSLAFQFEAEEANVAVLPIT